MERPICCSKPTRPYRKDYARGGFEEGFRCKVCKSIRIPDGIALDNKDYLESLEPIRLAGIEFDNSLNPA